jgi:MFS family permease
MGPPAPFFLSSLKAGMETYTKAEKNRILFSTSLANFIGPAMGSMINLALVSIGHDLDVGTHDLGWISSVFFIASVIALLPVARICTTKGKKRVFMAGLVLCIVGNLLSSIAPTFALLCATRILSGVSAACMSCSGIAMLSDVFPTNERGLALGINTAAVYLGGSLGPVIGGVLTDTLGWRSTFYIIIPLAAVALFGMYGTRADKALEPGGKIDYLGATFYGISIAFAMTGLINLPKDWAFSCMIFGILLVAVFVISQFKVKVPVFNFTIFRNVRFRRSVFAVILNYASTFAVSYFLSLYLQDIGAMTASQASLLLLLQPLIQTIFTPIAGRLSDRVDKRILPTVGMCITAVGLFMLTYLSENVNIAYTAASLTVLGFGYSLFSAPNTNAVMDCVRPKQYSDASAMVALMRQSGMMISMGIAMCVVAIVMGSSDHLVPENYDSFIDVMHTCWYVFIGFSLFGALISWFRGDVPTESV